MLDSKHEISKQFESTKLAELNTSDMYFKHSLYSAEKNLLIFFSFNFFSVWRFLVFFAFMKSWNRIKLLWKKKKSIWFFVCLNFSQKVFIFVIINNFLKSVMINWFKKMQKSLKKNYMFWKENRISSFFEQ